MLFEIILVFLIIVLFWSYGWKKGIFFLLASFVYAFIEIFIESNLIKNLGVLLTLLIMFFVYRAIFEEAED